LVHINPHSTPYKLVPACEGAKEVEVHKHDEKKGQLGLSYAIPVVSNPHTSDWLPVRKKNLDSTRVFSGCMLI
jgi:hypothetical protein